MGESGGRGRFTRWIERRPKWVFWTVLLVGLVFGAGIGAAVNDQRAEVSRLEGRSTALERDLSDTRAELDDVRGERNALDERIAKLTAYAAVPDFTGRYADDVQADELVAELRWNIKRIPRIAAEEPGTVIAQAPAEGVDLKADRALTLVVAKRAPPKPRQWVTIQTLTGGSSTKTEEFTVPAGLDARLKYAMPQDSNNAIILYKRPDDYIDLLLNEIGPQYGTTRLYRPGTFYLDVTGAYSIEVQVFKRPE